MHLTAFLVISLRADSPKAAMCRQVDAAKDGRCAEQFHDADDLAEAEDTADHADDWRDVLEDGGDAGTGIVHADVPEEHRHDAAEDDRVKERNPKRGRQHDGRELPRH